MLCHPPTSLYPEQTQWGREEQTGREAGSRAVPTSDPGGQRGTPPVPTRPGRPAHPAPHGHTPQEDGERRGAEQEMRSLTKDERALTGDR